MTSLISQTVARVLLPVLLLFALLLLLRGHNQPGGGFIGGLLAAIAFILQLIGRSAREVSALLPVSPRSLVGLGLLAALASTMVPVVFGQVFFSALWLDLELPWGGHFELGLPLLFDSGVFLVVFGITLVIVLTIAREEEER